MKEGSIIDLSCLEEYAGGDPDALGEMVKAFYGTADDSIKTLEDNISDGENPQWTNAAHKLKGAAGYVGSEVLRNICSNAQKMENCSKDDRLIAYENIKKAYLKVCNALKEAL